MRDKGGGRGIGLEPLSFELNRRLAYFEFWSVR